MNAPLTREPLLSVDGTFSLWETAARLRGGADALPPGVAEALGFVQQGAFLCLRAALIAERDEEARG